MSRNLNCNCLCHGSDGNRIGDNMFSCKNCYAAEHMGNLPRQLHEQQEPKKARKPRATRPQRPTGTVEAVAAAVKGTTA